MKVVYTDEALADLESIPRLDGQISLRRTDFGRDLSAKRPLRPSARSLGFRRAHLSGRQFQITQYGQERLRSDDF
jgi:hypothetical protein